MTIRNKFEQSIDKETDFLRLGLLSLTQSENINVCFWVALDGQFSMRVFFDLDPKFWENLI